MPCTVFISTLDHAQSVGFVYCTTVEQSSLHFHDYHPISMDDVTWYLLCIVQSGVYSCLFIGNRVCPKYAGNMIAF